MHKIEQLLSNVHGGTFISIDTVTPVKLKGGKANPFQGRVSKIVLGSNVMVFQNKNGSAYENMVNRRLAKEGKSVTFEVGPRAWGERIQGTPFVRHNGQLYLEVIFLKAGQRQYAVDGKPFDGDIPGLDEGQEEGEQGGLSNKVIIRTYNINNIARITVDGNSYEL